MNYQSHYNTLIERAKHRLVEGYVEKHHIIPQCMGGSTWVGNIVSLTPEEHYVAHQLLVKIYPNELKLIYTAKMMTIGKRRNNKLYGWLRKRHSSLLTSIPRSEEVKRKIGEKNKGKLKGRVSPMKGKTHSNSTKEKMREKAKGRRHSVETKQKQSDSRKKFHVDRKLNIEFN